MTKLLNWLLGSTQPEYPSRKAAYDALYAAIAEQRKVGL